MFAQLSKNCSGKPWTVRGLPGILQTSHRTNTWIMKFFSETIATTAFTKFKTKAQKGVSCVHVYINTQAHLISVKQLTSTYWRTGKDVKQKHQLHSIPKTVVDPCTYSSVFYYESLVSATDISLLKAVYFGNQHLPLPQGNSTRCTQNQQDVI